MADNNYTRAQPRRRLMLLSAALCLSLATAQVQTGERQCYWPNGQPSGYRPCSKDGGACCYNLDADHRDACYSNGMCQSGYFGNFYRGACTDRNWGGSCPNICKQGQHTPVEASSLCTLLSSRAVFHRLYH